MTSPLTLRKAGKRFHLSCFEVSQARLSLLGAWCLIPLPCQLDLLCSSLHKMAPEVLQMPTSRQHFPLSSSHNITTYIILLRLLPQMPRPPLGCLRVFTLEQVCYTRLIRSLYDHRWRIYLSKLSACRLSRVTISGQHTTVTGSGLTAAFGAAAARRFGGIAYAQSSALRRNVRKAITPGV